MYFTCKHILQKGIQSPRKRIKNQVWIGKLSFLGLWKAFGAEGDTLTFREELAPRTSQGQASLKTVRNVELKLVC